MTTIGILGTGRMGVRLAAAFARLGHSVLLASRAPARADAAVAQLGLSGVQAGDYRDAADADVVLPAIFLRDGLFDLLRPLAPRFTGKLFIDITNPFNADYSDFILPWDTSAAEQIHQHFPRVRLVGAFKNVWWQVFDAPCLDGLLTDVYVVGDDDHAKGEFLSLVDGMPFRFLDAGPLRHARTVERMTLLSGLLGRQLGHAPRMNYRLLGETAVLPPMPPRREGTVAVPGAT